MINQVVITTFILASFATVVLSSGQYGDVRCKCVCPSMQLPNSTEKSQKVYTESFNEPGRCKCENVVNHQLIDEYENFCARCECQWQRRNTTTIKGIVIFVIILITLLVLYMFFLLCLDPLLNKGPHRSNYRLLGPETAQMPVVVILIICVVSLLFLYMLFLLCLDPLMSRRPKTYLEQHNEEDTQSISTERIIEDGGARPRPGALMSRVKHEVNRVKGEQQKWKGTVQEQRKNIYDRHTMLN